MLPSRWAKAKTARVITEIRLHDGTLPSDFRVPLPATIEATRKGCTCPEQPKWPTVAVASDCPLHFVRARQQDQLGRRVTGTVASLKRHLG